MPEPHRNPIRILVVDDHSLFRESVGRLLAAEPGLEVAGLCASVEQALAALARTRVDVVLLDYDLGAENGLAFLRRAAPGFGGKVLLVTAGLDPTATTAVMRSGAAGVFPKHESAALLVQAIREVMAGKIWMRQDQMSALLQATERPATTILLSQRERLVLGGVLEGRANKEIAVQLGISESATKAALQQLFAKTGVRTRAQLVRIALERLRDQI